jgi:SPOR domain
VAEKISPMSDDLSVPNAGYRGSRFGRYGRISARMDPDTRRLMLFAGGVGGVLICLIGASTLIGHRTPGTVPVVAADPRPLRVKPDNPGGMQIDGAENSVFSGNVDTGSAKLAPAAEAPDPNGMHVVAAPPPPPKAAVVVQSVTPSVTTPPPPARPATVVAVAPPKPTPVAPVKPAVVAAAPIPAPAKPAMVQLAALTTEQAAREQWQQLVKRMPELLNGRQPTLSRFERDGRTFWRLRTAGFTDVAQAKTFCEHVRAKGGGCSIADF